MHLEKQQAIIDALTEDQKVIYTGIGWALKTQYGTDQGFIDGLAALTALKATMELALEEAKADGVFPAPGCPKEEHY